MIEVNLQLENRSCNKMNLYNKKNFGYDRGPYSSSSSIIVDVIIMMTVTVITT